MKLQSYLTLFTILLNSHALSVGIIEEIDCSEHYQDTKLSPSMKIRQTPSFQEIESSLDPVVFVQKFNSPEQERIEYELISKHSSEYRITYLTNVFLNPSKHIVMEQEITPSIVFETSFGTLLGSDRGEWIGELVLIDSDLNLIVLGKMNVKDIYQLPFGIVVASGLAHLSSNTGELYLVQPSSELVLLYSLVGAPKSSWLLPNGDLLINSFRNGSQVITTDGVMKRVTCEANNTLNTEASKAGSG